AACYGQPSMIRTLALLMVALLAAGCATRASYHRLTADVAALRGEVTELRQAQEAAARDLARTAAEARALETRVSEVSQIQASAANELATLRQRVATAEAERREARAQAVAATPPAVTPAPAAPKPSAPAERPRESAAGESPEKAYAAAMATFHAREYGQAGLDFTDFINRHPRPTLAANAQYWIGEAYYVQRDYRQAMTEFQKVLDARPDSPKVPDALLKVGLCYRSLHDESRARQTWDRLAKDYPKSEAARTARTLMRGKT